MTACNQQFNREQRLRSHQLYFAHFFTFISDLDLTFVLCVARLPYLSPIYGFYCWI